MKFSFKIGSIWGIPIELHLTFLLLIVAIFALSLLSNLNFYFFFIIIALFVFVVFHELAHSLVARRYNIKVRKIVLYPIGGVSEIEDPPNNPAQEWRMSLSGPLTSLILGAIILAIGLILTPQLLPAALTFTLTGNLILDLATLNILLGLFNLIPAFPMDGGRVLRAVLAQHMNYSKATRLAVITGRILGIAMVIVGFILPGYFLLIIIGLFVYIGANQEGQQTQLTTKLAQIQVKDIMQPDTTLLDSNQTLTEALEHMQKNQYHNAIVQKNGVYIGIVTQNEITKIPPEQQNLLHIEQIPLVNVVIFDDQSILEADKLRLKEQIDLLPVAQKQNPTQIIGTLTTKNIAQAYEKTQNPNQQPP